jgi:hypothetical protein
MSRYTVLQNVHLTATEHAVTICISVNRCYMNTYVQALVNPITLHLILF